MSITKGKKDSEAFALVDDLVLASTPNIALKATSLSHYTTDLYSHHAAHGALKKSDRRFWPHVRVLGH